MSRILVVDVGGNNIKLRLSGSREKRRTPSGPTLTPEIMVAKVAELTQDWSFGRDRERPV